MAVAKNYNELVEWLDYQIPISQLRVFKEDENGLDLLASRFFLRMFMHTSTFYMCTFQLIYPIYFTIKGYSNKDYVL